MSRKRRQQDRKGRSTREEQYIALPYNKVRSDAFRSLNGAAVKVYLELHSRFWGGNNGELSLSLEEGARLLGMGKSTVKRALEELEEKGFIEMMRRGQFVGRQASEYRLTGQRYQGHLATRDWVGWKPGMPINSEHGPEVAHIGIVTVPFQNQGGKFRAI